MSTKRHAPRPNRGGEEFARNNYDNSGPDAKKPRFDVRNPSALAPDAPEEADVFIEADEIGKKGQQTKRNAINIDGYESDSSNEGFDARAAAKAKEGTAAKETKGEEDGDMFADMEDDFQDGDEDEESAGKGKKKRKEVRFMAEDDIEGQVGSSKSGGHVSADLLMNGKGKWKEAEVESSSESDVGDEERADVGEVDDEIGAGGKKEHAPKLDAFNMKNEQEEGRFDAQGNFVRKAADPDAVHDSWLEGVSKKDMRRAKEAADQRENEERQRRLADDAVLTSDILKGLIPYLERGETVLEALARFGKGREKKKPKWQKNSRKGENAMDVDGDRAAAEDPVEMKRREAVEAITGAADQLLTRGQTEIYEAERELLMRQYSRETGESWVDPPVHEVDREDGSGQAEGKMWEYMWVDGRDGGRANGPYDGSMMRSWSDAGYFGEGVEFREVGGDGWARSVDFV